tara:strand:+ start:591 stop:971 length:381 start_codon:yes stop_codon:yes gene_type:complete
MATGSKSASAFRTISEVATELNLPQHVLRFWETKFNQIHPLKRGGGRRYYRPEDIDLLRQIRGLLYDNGYTIKGAQKLLRNGSAKNAPKVEAEKVTENADPVGYNAELQSILSELRDIQGLLRNWA